MQLGVSSNAIVKLDGPRATREEIDAFADLCRTRKWKRIGVISSAVHLPRVRAHCRRQRLDVEYLPASFLGTRYPLMPRHLVPQAEGFRLVEAACWEIVGKLVGR
jgi:uncharacterized SAM-binding protein YcdF (DUF218 family)